MNAERLLAHYEQIMDAPDAIAQLRRFILDLAVRGKLVPQDTAEEDASELLKRIAAEKTRLVKARGIRPPKAIPELSEQPFSIPSNWRWSQLAEIGVLNPRNEAPDALEASFVPMPLIAAEYGVPNRHETRPWGEIKKGYTHFAEGDVGLAKITPCFENRKSTVFRNLTGGMGSGTTELHIIRPLFVDQEYILLFLKSPHFIETGIPKMTGTAGQKRVPAEYFAHSPFPLPPLAEQRRIVAKVDELMGLCDTLEAARAGREAVRDRLTAASLARLNVPDPETFKADARFALDTLSALTTRPDQIKAMRQTILNLAVRGKLVPQHPSDEPASELLTRIAKEKAERVISARDQGATKINPLTGDEVPFPAPPNWVWASLGDITISRDGERIPVSREEREKKVKVYDYYGASGVIDKIDGYLFDKPLLLIGEDGANLINRSTPIAFIARGEYWVNNHAHVLDGISEGFLRYVELFINAIDLKPYVTGTAQPKMNQAKMNSIPVAMPPLTEQHRIVAKVDELMALCDALEGGLASISTIRHRLLDALLAKALAPVVDQELEAAE
ncbi:MAG: restriction endonuclease subunit S [Pseudonocardiaceae bacterium]|nr:MAG: restriction endonuclease subunit S [Pseudonocardiaceae bacterium]